jgi:hypothetical protein
MSGVFSAGVWDKPGRAEGVHVFGRKLLYGNEHDSAEHLPEGTNASSYGQVELHKLHAFYRKNALKMMSELVRRAPKGSEVKMYKEDRGKALAWPGDLGKHHALIEEMIKLGVVSLHQDETTRSYAQIHPAALKRAVDKYCTLDTTLAGGTAGAAPVSAPTAPVSGAVTGSSSSGNAKSAALQAAAAAAQQAPFLAADAFAGPRAGYVFKRGEHGVGYYADGVLAATAAALAEAAEVLPVGWVKGVSPEGYPYYWHHETSTSSWERPTAPPIIERSVPLSATTAAALVQPSNARGAGISPLAQIEEQSGATIGLARGTSGGERAYASVRGHSHQVDRAVQLLERKAAAIAFAARALPFSAAASGAAAAPPLAPPPSAVAGADYSFASVAGYVAAAEVSRTALKQHRQAQDSVVVGGGGEAAATAGEPAAKRAHHEATIRPSSGDQHEGEPATTRAHHEAGHVSALAALAAYGDDEDEEEDGAAM